MTHSEIILGYIIRENTVKGHKIRTTAARDDGVAFKVLAAFIKDPGSVSITHIHWLTIAFNFSSRGSKALFLQLWVLAHTLCTHIHIGTQTLFNTHTRVHAHTHTETNMHTHTHKINNLKKKIGTHKQKGHQMLGT